MTADLTDGSGNLILVVIIQKAVKLDHVTFQGGRNHAGLLSDLHLHMGKGKTGGLADVIFLRIFGHTQKIIYAYTGRYLGKYRTNQGL